MLSAFQAFKAVLKPLMVLGVFLLAITTINLSANVPPAFARIQQQTEAPGQVVYQARHTLKDSKGDAWQVILYKRIKQTDNEIVATTNLRLAGFPDAVEFVHPDELKIETDRGQTLTAPDRFAEKNPAPNIGEYQLNAVVNQLPERGTLKLTLPVREGDRILQIPYPVILEWQDVLNETGGVADFQS
ncbi:hypothetical protein AY599_04265 [Leptolyngbya valderiana BDU 20041]|nr:hypothetical protein AY599_04265 [Leptolyngbya valderiana BDU 20041]PPT09883.1 hypothetical protein CKA32_000890 [Geitlerinema sp. FC II]